MAEVTYTAVTWTAGDIITEAKMDNMVANDRAVDAMANGIEFTERADPSTPGANKIHLYAKDKSGVPTLYAINDAGTVYELAESLPTYQFPISFPYVASTIVPPLLAIKDSTIIRCAAYADTAPTGADLIFDINIGGTSIWASTQANRIKIVASAQTGTQTSFDTTSLSQDDPITIDVDQVGSTTAGQDTVVALQTK